MSVDLTKKLSFGRWVSVVPEVRPSNVKNPDGTLKPFYLTRDFSLYTEDRFELTVTNFSDPNGEIPLVKMNLKGTIEWLEEHPITAGAIKVNFTADEDYTVSALAQDLLIS